MRTVREAIQIEESKWKPFRRQLKGENRDRLDRLFDYARTYADAASMVARPHTPDAVYMCALLGLMERIEELERINHMKKGYCVYCNMKLALKN